MPLSSAVLLLPLLLAACKPVRPASPDVAFIPVPGGAELPFSEAVRVGPLLFLSGQIGNDSSGQPVPGGIEAETRQTLENIKGILERNGSSLEHVVKCTAMLADIADWPAMNRVYVGYFKAHLPARSAFATAGLVRGARIELECWATVPS